MSTQQPDVVLRPHDAGVMARLASERAQKTFARWGPSRMALATSDRELAAFLRECRRLGFIVQDDRAQGRFPHRSQ